MRRLAGQGGDPVVELQTNFGGGKTHSMLALYHLAAGTPSPARSPASSSCMAEAGVAAPAASPAGPCWSAPRSRPASRTEHDDGIADAHAVGRARLAARRRATATRCVAEADQARRQPRLAAAARAARAATRRALILIDEWVAFARQLYGDDDLPAGTFDTQHDLRPGADRGGQGDARRAAGRRPSRRRDIEIGGEGGEVALERLKNIFGRIESSWRPASAEEGFEIVRRRLFEPMADRELFAARDAVVKAFADLYREQRRDVPGRVQRGRLPAPPGGRLPDPPRAVRPAVQRLVDARPVPAHPRRPAPDGGRDPRALGAGRQGPADHAGLDPARRSHACRPS